MRIAAFLPVIVIAAAAALWAGQRARPLSAPVERGSTAGREVRRVAGLLRALFADAERSQERIYAAAVADLRARHAKEGKSGADLDRAVFADPALLPVARYGSKVMQIKVGGGEVARELDFLADRLFRAGSDAEEEKIRREGIEKLGALAPKIVEYTEVLDGLAASVGEKRLEASARLISGLEDFARMMGIRAGGGEER